MPTVSDLALSFWKMGSNYSEDDVFDVIEFLYDNVSKPVKGFYHQFNGCGWHYETFNKEQGQEEFRIVINDLLKDYSKGFELSNKGEILKFLDKGLDTLIDAKLPTYDPENIENRVENAINKFRRYKSSQSERKDAIRDLVDVLEYLRPKIQKIISKKDENDLFEIANKFGIRHHDLNQKIGYEKSIWYSWMFYYYLSTIHACLRLLEIDQEGKEEK